MRLSRILLGLFFPLLFAFMAEIVVFKIKEFTVVSNNVFIIVGIVSIVFVLLIEFLISFINYSKRIHNFFVRHLMVIAFLVFVSLLVFMCIHTTAYNTLDDLKFGITLVWTITGVTAAIFAILFSRQKTLLDLVDFSVEEENKSIQRVATELNEYSKESIHSFLTSNIKGFSIIITSSTIFAMISTLLYFETTVSDIVKENLVYIALILSVLLFVFIVLILAIYFILKLHSEKKTNNYEMDFKKRDDNLFIIKHYNIGKAVIDIYGNVFENVTNVNIASEYGQLVKNIKSFDQDKELFEKAQKTNSILLSLYNLLKEVRKSDKKYEEVYAYLKTKRIYLLSSMYTVKS